MTLTHDMYNMLMLIGIPLGVVQCFFGYRLFKIIIGIIGFIIGGVLAGKLTFFLYPETAVVIIAGLIGGLLGAAAILTFYYVGIFLIGTIFGGIVGSFFCSVAGVDPIPVVLIISAAIAGMVALWVQKYMIVASTAFGGSWLIISGIAYFVTGAKHPAEVEHLLESSGNLYFIIFICWIALGILGLLAQLKWFPSELKGEERDLAEKISSS